MVQINKKFNLILFYPFLQESIYIYKKKKQHQKKKTQ